MANSKNTIPPALLDHIAYMNKVVGALGLAIEGLRLDQSTPNEASIEGLGWLADHAHAAAEVVYALASDSPARWRVLGEEAQMLRDLEAVT